MKKPNQHSKSEPNKSAFFGKSDPEKPTNGSKGTTIHATDHSSKSMPALTQSTDGSLKFVLDKKDEEVCDVFLEDEHLGNIGTNMCGIISVYFDLYYNTKACLKLHAPDELDKEYTITELQGLVKEQHKLAIDITIYQMGKTVFNSFRAMVKEPDTWTRISMTPKILKNVSKHRDVLAGKSVKVTKDNIRILEIVIDTLNRISMLLEEFKMSTYITSIPAATPIVTSIVKSQSVNAKNAASAFNEAKQFYKGNECVVKIRTIKDIAIEGEKVAKEEKKAVKRKEKGSKDDKKEVKTAPKIGPKKTSAVEPASKKDDRKHEEEEAASEEKGFW